MFRSALRDSTTNAARSACAKHWIKKELIMALAGDEKKIQALFSELAFEDQRSAPHFRRGALLIRGLCRPQVPALRSSACALHRVRDTRLKAGAASG